MNGMRKYRSPIILFLVFEFIAIFLWQTSGNLFFLLNFTYIGLCVGLGGILFSAGWKYAREFTQFTVGSYMLVFLGLMCRENMQIEGRCQDIRSSAIWQGMVWICLLDSHGS